ncbi:hypothetical protein UT300019_23950 [Clostridium sp. CTA-19]
MSKKLSEENQKKQEKWYTHFKKDKYKALWDLGVNEKEDWMSPTITVLFIFTLSTQSDIEFVREEANLTLSEYEVEDIKKIFHFQLEWNLLIIIGLNLFGRKLMKYIKEISNYNGTVKEFLLERNTNINKLPLSLYS